MNSRYDKNHLDNNTERNFRLLDRPRKIVILCAIMMLSYGLAFSYTGIYIARESDLGLRGSAVYYTMITASGIIAGLILSSGFLKLQSHSRVLMATVLGAASFMSLAIFVPTIHVIVVSAIGIGIGTVTFQTGINTVLVNITDPFSVRKIFGFQQQANNIAMGIGIAATSVLVTNAGIAILNKLFIVCAVLHMPIIFQAILWHSSKKGLSNSTSHKLSGLQSVDIVRSKRNRAAHQCFPYILIQFICGIFILQHLESTIPLWIEQRFLPGSLIVATLLVSNVMTTLLLQQLVTKIVSQIKPDKSLLWALVFWAISMFTGLLFIPAAGGMAVGVAVLVGLLSGVGDCIHACSVIPGVVDSTSSDLTELAITQTTVAMSVGRAIGVNLGMVAISGIFPVYFIWLLLGGGLITASAGWFFKLRRNWDLSEEAF